MPESGFDNVNGDSVVTLIPIFQVGVWNAWIPGLFILLHPYIMKLVDKLVGAGDIDIKMGAMPIESGSKRPIPLPTLLLIALFILSIFIPLKTGTIWILAGLAIYLAGITIFLSAIITAAKTPDGRVFSTGIYRYSRHPMYLSFFLVFVGISLASASWLFLLLSMGWMAFPMSQVSQEELECMSTFGSDYSAYMDRTPKWIVIPKS